MEHPKMPKQSNSNNDPSEDVSKKRGLNQSGNDSKANKTIKGSSFDSPSVVASAIVEPSKSSDPRKPVKVWEPSDDYDKVTMCVVDSISLVTLYVTLQITRCKQNFIEME
jgi:hypothetical protein